MNRVDVASNLIYLLGKYCGDGKEKIKFIAVFFNSAGIGLAVRSCLERLRFSAKRELVDVD